jgi:hypothetical protein
MDKRIGAGEQAPGRIVHIDFNVKRSRVEIDGIRISDNCSFERLIRKSIQRNRHRSAVPQGGRVDLGNRNVYARSVCVAAMRNNCLGVVLSPA